MSKITDLIFNGANHHITSAYGKRKVINTTAGDTASFHSGTDYGTDNKKLPQYAIEEGYIMDASRAADGALYVWIIYPRCKLAMLHYHLDSYAVYAGQKVKKGTYIGDTGMTGKATGIHLHLGIKSLANVSNVNAVKYADLNKISYTDPEKVSYTAPAAATTKSRFLPAKGYFAKGDVSAKVNKIALFMLKTFPAYTKTAALGNTYGDNLIAAIKEFQKRTGLVVDGMLGAKTLAMLKRYGFKE